MMSLGHTNCYVRVSPQVGGVRALRFRLLTKQIFSLFNVVVKEGLNINGGGQRSGAFAASAQ